MPNAPEKEAAKRCRTCPFSRRRPDLDGARELQRRKRHELGVEIDFMRMNPAREFSTLRGRMAARDTGSPEEMARCRTHFPIGTQLRPAFDLMVYAGVSRSDACRVGRRHSADGRIVFQLEKAEN